MVGLPTSSQTLPSAKKQQSISTFFTKNAAPSKSAPAPTPAASFASKQQAPSDGLIHHDGSGSLFISSNEEEDTFQPTAKLLPKRGFEIVDTNGGRLETEQSHAKRRRLSDEHRKGPLNPVSEGHDSENPKSIPIALNQVKKPRVTEQTSKYTYSSSPRENEENGGVDDQETAQRKERLHQSFVKKLGRPDSIAEIKRRNWQNAEDNGDGEPDANDAEEAEEELSPRPVTKGKKGVAGKKGPSKLTPMEKQFLDIKRANVDTVLIVEVGYKFKFFGEDARVAAKELSIVCIPGKMRYDEHVSEAHLDRFASASVPVHRLHIHVKRLVNAGHKVGVVRQLETAALKAAGDNRNAPFVRKLTNLYTKGTYIDDIEGLEGPTSAPSGGTPATGYLVCITENNTKGWGTDEKVHVGIVAVQPATGDVVYDDFEDGFMRSEIETRLLHIAPCEILIVGDLSRATDKLVQHLSGSRMNVFGDKVRVERVDKPKTMAAQAYSHVSNFYAGKIQPASSQEDEKANRLLDNVLKLPEDVTTCLSAMITHMSEYGLEHVFDLTKYFQCFSGRSHMLLNGTTLSSLEIYQNQTDRSERGSLFWTLDRTRTRFGKRLLRKWVGRPLLVQAQLEERISAVEELLHGASTAKVDKIKHLLAQIRSDLEKSLIRIYYGKVGVRRAVVKT